MSDELTHNPVTINLAGVESPYLAQYLGLWSMMPEVIEEMASWVASIDLRDHAERQRLKKIAQHQASEGNSSALGSGTPTAYQYSITDGGVAIVDATGMLMKAESSLGDSTSTTMLRRTVRDVRNQFKAGKVKAMMIRVDSPGGSTDGTEAVAAEIAMAGTEMPVAGYADGMAASAAYWMLSQAPTISVNSTGLVGSIGTYRVVRDTSAAASQMGVKVHVVKSAEAKAAGVPGTEITAKQLSEWQRMIDASQAVFTAAVASGRRVPLSKAQEWADARVHVGKDAMAIGLVDHVESFDAALARLEAAAAKSPAPRDLRMKSDLPTQTNPAEAAAEETGASAPASEAGAEANSAEQNALQKGSDMSQTTTTAPSPVAQEPKDQKPVPATTAELKAAFPGAASDWILDQSISGATLEQATQSFIGWQSAQINARDEEITKLKSAAPATTQAPVKPVGVKAVAQSAAETKPSAGAVGTATAEFDARVSELVAKGQTPQKAAQSVFAADDDLRARYLAEKNGR